MEELTEKIGPENENQQEFVPVKIDSRDDIDDSIPNTRALLKDITLEVIERNFAYVNAKSQFFKNRLFVWDRASILVVLIYPLGGD